MRVLVIGDVNASVGESKAEGILGTLRVSGMYKNGRKLIGLCTEKKLSAGIIFLRRTSTHLHGCVE